MKFLRVLLCIALTCVNFNVDARVPRGSNVTVQNRGGIQGSFDSVVYYSNVRPTTNWAIAGGPRNYNLVAGGSVSMDVATTSGYLDTNGELAGGSAISAINGVKIDIFTVPIGIGNPISDPIVGPTSATFQGTVSTTTLTANCSGFSGTILPYDVLTGPSVTGQNTTTHIQPYGTSGTTGVGGCGTYALDQSSTVSSASSLTTRTNWWTGLPMTITWTGTGVTSVTQNGTLGSGSTALSCNLGTNTCTFALGYNPSNVDFQFNFTAGTSSPPTKILIYENAEAARMATCVAGLANTIPPIECFSAAWVAQVGPIGIKRYMNWLGANSSGVTDISQYADFNYTVFAGGANGCGGGGTGNITIAGTTATITGPSTGFNLYNGDVLVDAGNNLLAANTTLTSGSNGGAGTYSVTPSQTVSNVTFTGSTAGASTTLNATGASGTPVVGMTLTGTAISAGGGPTTIIGVTNLGGGSFTITMDRVSTGTVSGTVTAKPWFRMSVPIGGTFGSGFKCGVHPSIIIALANATNTDIHYNFPATFNDASVTAVSALVRDNLKLGLHFGVEEVNENWNGAIGVGFYVLEHIGWTRFQNGTSSNQQAGYSASHMFNLINNAFGPSGRSRWRGMAGGQLATTAATPTAFMSGFTAWNSDTSSNFTPWALFDDVQIAPYVTDTMQITTPTGMIYTMINDSVSCYNQTAGATLTGASITGNALTFASASGTVLLGQGLGGVAGIPANTYINTGSGLSWTLNNSVVGTVTGTMTTTPCATRYQWFAQEYSKALITGTNDYGYTIGGVNFVNGWTTALQANQVFAGSQGLSFRNYEGFTQIFTTGADPLGEDFYWNWKQDPAGNDPLYTPAKLVDAMVAQQNAVFSGYPSIYTIDGSMGTFGQWNYPGDNNPAWAEILRINALGPYVDPAPAAAWSVNYGANFTANSTGTTSFAATGITGTIAVGQSLLGAPAGTIVASIAGCPSACTTNQATTLTNAAISAVDRTFPGGSGTTLSCPFTAQQAGLGVFGISQTSTVIPSQITIDGGAAITTPDDAASASNAWRPTTWSAPVATGAHTLAVTWPSSVSFRTCYSLVVSGLQSTTPHGGTHTASQTQVTVPVTKGGFIFSMATLTSAATLSTVGNCSNITCASGRVSGNIQQVDNQTVLGQNSGLGIWTQGPDFSTGIFNVRQNGSNGISAASYGP